MLTYKDIIKEDDPRLRLKSEPVNLPLSKEDIETLLLMNEYLLNGYDEEKAKQLNIRPGVGLSAVQIGILKQMFVICGYDENNNLHHYGVINPKIISHSEQLTFLESGEGCLSVDRETYGLVHRPMRITAKCTLFDFETFETKKTTLKLKGYMAIVFQHEYDHLHGILFFDHINKQNPFFVPSNSTPVSFSEK
ncbi:MAG TPA: peptide deformylase [Acholeplasmataceae bacterium]|jgi:peptide deformylase|nr:peptide deformylase [Acholeplasmataceae bacterium]